MDYDVAIVLGSDLKPNNTLGKETRARMEKGVELVHSLDVGALILSGGYIPQTGDAPRFRHAEAMYLYARNAGVPDKQIYLEPESRELVGQAVFTQRRIIDILEARDTRWRNVQVITSDYDALLAQEVFEFVFGPAYNIMTVGLPTTLAHDETKAQETVHHFKVLQRNFQNAPALGDRHWTRNDHLLFHLLHVYHNLYVGLH